MLHPTAYGSRTLCIIFRITCVDTWKVLCEREEMTLAKPVLYVWLGGQRGRAPRQTPEPNWISNGKTPITSQSDRIQVIGGKLLTGQLAPWVTWEALPPSARYERRVGVSLVRAAWERRPEGPAYLLPSVTLLYLAG